MFIVQRSNRPDVSADCREQQQHSNVWWVSSWSGGSKLLLHSHVLALSCPPNLSIMLFCAEMAYCFTPIIYSSTTSNLTTHHLFPVFVENLLPVKWPMCQHIKTLFKGNGTRKNKFIFNKIIPLLKCEVDFVLTFHQSSLESSASKSRSPALQCRAKI